MTALMHSVLRRCVLSPFTRCLQRSQEIQEVLLLVRTKSIENTYYCDRFRSSAGVSLNGVQEIRYPAVM